MSTELPYISALLPSRNGDKYLIRLVPHILEMLGDNDELLIVNDGSSDDSSFILAEFAKTDSRLRVLTTEGVGLVAALNLGINEAKNPWIARFDVDDEYPPNRIELQRKLIADDVVAIFSDYSFISSTGIPLGILPSAITSNPTKLSLVSGQRTPHPVVLLNKASLLSVGGYRVEEFPIEDLCLWFRMMERGEFVTTPEVLLRYRLSGNSISSSNRIEQLAKKSQVISDFRSWQILIESCINEFSKTITCYLRQQRSAARVILHFRDLVLASKLSGIKVPLVKLFLSLPFSTLIKVPFVLVDIFAKLILRRVYRLVKNFL